MTVGGGPWESLLRSFSWVFSWAGLLGGLVGGGSVCVCVG